LPISFLDASGLSINLPKKRRVKNNAKIIYSTPIFLKGFLYTDMSSLKDTLVELFFSTLDLQGERGLGGRGGGWMPGLSQGFFCSP